MGPLALAAALLAEGQVVDHRAQALLILIFHLFQLIVEVLPALLLVRLLVMMRDRVVLGLLCERIRWYFYGLVVFVPIFAHLAGHWPCVLHDLLPVAVGSLAPPLRWVRHLELVVLLDLCNRFQLPRAVD